MNQRDEEVRIEEYDPSWPDEFVRERGKILVEFEGEPLEIEHIGSTAVPSLAAKPIIDILMGVRDITKVDSYGERLGCMGYVYQWQEDEPDRVFFRKGMPRTHHLHIVEHGGETWHRHILFRDILRMRDEMRREYEALKKKLVTEFREDREGYSESKSGWIDALLADEGK